MKRIILNKLLLSVLLLASTWNSFADGFTDSLTEGINSTYWIVRTNTALFTVNATGGGIVISKPSGSVSDFQAALLASLLVAQGNFDVQVDFTNANVNWASGSIGNQIQLNTRFGGQDFLMVRSDESQFGNNAHVFQNPPGRPGVGAIAWSNSYGRLRVVRTGTLVQGYIDSTLIYSNYYNTNDATFSFVLQNNATSDAVAATFKKFSLTADRLVSLPAQMGVRQFAPTNAVLSWKDTSWPDTLAGYTLQSATNLAGTIVWQTLTNQPTLRTNQFFLTNSTSGSQKFFQLEQGPESYH